MHPNQTQSMNIHVHQLKSMETDGNNKNKMHSYHNARMKISKNHDND